MKFPVLLLTGFLCSVHLSAQITVSPYPREISCQVDATGELEAPAASSACGEVSVEVKEEIFSGGCLGTLVRTYLYSDGCGQKATAEQYVRLLDNLEPQFFGIPDDMEASAEALPAVVTPAAWDNSGQPVEPVLRETREGNTLVRTWTVSDPCGNTATAVQRIRLR